MGRRRTRGFVAGALVFLVMMSGLSEAGGRKSWGPQIGPSNPRHLPKSRLQMVAGPHGIVRCGSRPLLIDPWIVAPRAPWAHRVRIVVLTGRSGADVSPTLFPRCAGPGKIAWYVEEEDPLRTDPTPGAPITLSIPVPGPGASEKDLGYLVGTGGCVTIDGVAPPCVPEIPPGPFLARHFRTLKPTLLNLSAEIAVRSIWARDDAAEGNADVRVELEVNGNLLGEGKTFTLSGEETRSLRLSRRFRLPAGRHQIGLRLTGTGFNYVNVEGKSARVTSYLSKTFRLK